MRIGKFGKCLLFGVIAAIALSAGALASTADTVISAVVNGNKVHAQTDISSMYSRILMAAVYGSDGRMKETKIRDDLVTYTWHRSVTFWMEENIEPTDKVKVFIMDAQCVPIGRATEAEHVSFARPTNRQQMAENSANNYLDFLYMSCDGLIGQLLYDGYSYTDCVYAADTYSDWENQARKKITSYVGNGILSTRQELFQQLLGEEFTMGQTTAALDWYFRK